MVMRTLGMTLCLCGLLSATALAQQYQRGDKVVVVSMTHLTVSGSRIVDKVWPGLTLTVRDVNGEWLWLSNGKPGWLEQRHVVPLGRQAIDRLTAMIRSDSKNTSLYSGRADVWEHLGELDIAIADYNEAIRLSPDDGAAYGNRGSAWRAKGEYDKAIADYNEAVRLDPKYVTAYHNRGSALDRKGAYDKAIEDYNEAIRIDPKFVHAYKNRGLTWRHKGEYDKAIE